MEVNIERQEFGEGNGQKTRDGKGREWKEKQKDKNCRFEEEREGFENAVTSTSAPSSYSGSESVERETVEERRRR